MLASIDASIEEACNRVLTVDVWLQRHIEGNDRLRGSIFAPNTVKAQFSFQKR